MTSKTKEKLSPQRCDFWVILHCSWSSH